VLEGGFNCWNLVTRASPSRVVAQELEGGEGTVFCKK